MRVPLVWFLATLIGPTAFAQQLPEGSYVFGDFTLCDVHLLAKAWGVKDDAARQKLDAMVAAGASADARAQVTAASQGVTGDGFGICSYHEAGFDYYDAESLAQLWGLADPYEAKGRIENKLIQHQIGPLVADWKTAIVQFPRQVEPSVDYVQAFYDANLDYCDAAVMAAVWGIDVWDAKISLGKAMINGEGKALAKPLAKARKKYAKKVCG